MNRYDKQDAEQDRGIFKDVMFLVKATDNEHHELWHQWHHEPRHGRKLQWEQVMLGHGVTIGHLDDRPIVVSCTYAIIEGKRVMFYHACSELVDHKMVQEWLQHYTKNVRWDGGLRWAHCDAQNFHLCLHALTGRE